MSDSFEFTLHSPMTKEDWNKLSDVEFENTPSVTFQTPQGRQVRYIKCEVIDKIRSEIDEQYDRVHLYDISCAEGLEMALDIIDKYIAEGSEE